MSLLNAIQRENLDAVQQIINTYPNDLNRIYETLDGEPYTLLDEVLRKMMMENRNEHSALHRIAVFLLQQGAKTYDQIESNIESSYWRNNFPNYANQPSMNQPPVIMVAQQQSRSGKPPLAPKRPKFNATNKNKRGIAFLPRTRRTRRSRQTRQNKHRKT